MLESRRDRVNRILEEAVGIDDAAERRAFVVGACEGDADLLNEVEQLLACDDEPHSLLDAPERVLREGLDAVEGDAERLDVDGDVATTDWKEVAPQASEPPKSGPEYLGRYRIVRELGRGGMGVVYEGRDDAAGRLVAIKAPLARTSAEYRGQLLNEARAAARVKHPGVVQIYDVVGDHDPPFLVFEHVEGITLAQRLKELGRLPLDQAVRYVAAVADALAAAHAQQVIHRDVKPLNIMLASGDRVKLLDLGIAQRKFDFQNPEPSLAGGLLGTVDYMSPEQARDAASVDHLTDVYSLACTLFQLVEGEALFPGSMTEKLQAHKAAPPRGLSQRPDGDEAARRRVESVMLKMLAKDPQERPQTMAAVATALRSAIAGERPRFDRRLGAAALAIATVVLLACIWWWNQPIPINISFQGAVDPAEIELLTQVRDRVRAANRWEPEFSSTEAVINAVAALIQSEPAARSFKELMKAGPYKELSAINAALFALDQRLDGVIPAAWRNASSNVLRTALQVELTAQRVAERNNAIAALLHDEQSTALLRRWNVVEFPPAYRPADQDRWINAFCEAVDRDVEQVAQYYEQIELVRETTFGDAGTMPKVILRTSAQETEYKGEFTVARYTVWLKLPKEADRLLEVAARRPRQNLIAADAKAAGLNSGDVAQAQPLSEFDTGVRLTGVRFTPLADGSGVELDWSAGKAQIDADVFRAFVRLVGAPAAFAVVDERMSFGADARQPSIVTKFRLMHRDLDGCRGDNSVTIDVHKTPPVQFADVSLAPLADALPRLLLEARRYRGLPISVREATGENIYPCTIGIEGCPALEFAASFDEEWNIRFSGAPSVKARDELARRLCRESSELRRLAPLATVADLRVEGAPARVAGDIVFTVEGFASTTLPRELAPKFTLSAKGRLNVTIPDGCRAWAEGVVAELPEKPTTITREQLEARLLAALASRPELEGVVALAGVEISDLGALATFSVTLGDWPQLRVGPIAVSRLDQAGEAVEAALSAQSLMNAAESQWTRPSRHPRFGDSETKLVAWNPVQRQGEVITQMYFGPLATPLTVRERVRFGRDASTTEVFDSTNRAWRASDAEGVARSIHPHVQHFCRAASESLWQTSGVDAMLAVDDENGQRMDWLRLSPPSLRLNGEVFIPVIEARIGVSGVTIDEHGIHVARVPITLERTFYSTHFAASDPRIEIDFDNSGLKLGVALTPPMVPVGGLFKPGAYGASTAVQGALSAGDSAGLAEAFGLNRFSGRRVRWDNLWLHVLRGDFEVAGNLAEPASGIPGFQYASRTSPAGRRAIQQTLGAAGRLVVLDAQALAEGHGKITLQNGHFRSLHAQAAGELPCFSQSWSRVEGELSVVSGEGMSVAGMFYLSGIQVDGRLTVLTSKTPMAVSLDGRASLPVVGVVHLQGESSLAFDDYRLTAKGYKDFDWFVGGMRRINYRYVQTPTNHKFEWWWNTPDGREVHYTIERPSDLPLDEEQMREELQHVVEISDDPQVVREIKLDQAQLVLRQPASDSTSGVDPPSVAPSAASSEPPPSLAGQLLEGDDEDAGIEENDAARGGSAGAGSETSEGGVDGRAPSAAPSGFPVESRGVDLDVLVEGDVLKVVAKGTDVVYGRLTTEQAGVQDWSKCRLFYGWTAADAIGVTALEYIDLQTEGQFVPIVFDSPATFRCPAIAVREDHLAFARRERAFDVTSLSGAAAGWIVAEAIELEINGFQVNAIEGTDGVYVATASHTQAPERRWAVFGWTDDAGPQRAISIADQVDLEEPTSVARRLTAVLRRDFTATSSYADIVVAFRSGVSGNGSEGRAALLRQVGRSDYVLEFSTAEGLKRLDVKVSGRVSLPRVAAIAKSCVEAFWDGRGLACDSLRIGPAGTCGVHANGWVLVSAQDQQRSGWENAVTLSRPAFAEWDGPSAELLPAWLRSPEQRRSLSESQVDALAQQVVSSWRLLRGEKASDRWQAHPMGLLIERARQVAGAL